ncbi:hypothetical protein O1611_g1349 [Lasiodiplodia mahajangana]|uniref:Uncharacterized protein n=1 Tax=Lasiodiplodia mahajangana TaxID=1108764 RepID=A0ACC2JXN4_9PEZI|nr:hypothetical protein O1611_g1349 [Lasiodiplodia mahajangana]
MGIESLPAISNQPSILSEPPHHGLFDSFSWLDEDDDLDLRLTLDNYHVDLKPSRPVTNAGPPSLFRRRLSVNKLSLGRSSISSSRPGTRGSSFADQSPIIAHSRRTSRALSLITPKHRPQTSVSSIDPAAAHYQDPEARHKLRAYLASPQKFDEALEFGFPANNAHSVIVPGGSPRRSRSFSRGLYMASSDKLKTFLSDDHSSIASEETSIPDSESPRTPHTPETQLPGMKLFHLPSNSTAFPSKLSENYCPIATREMTMRMTLTRPDLRSHQEDSYARSNNVAPNRPSRSFQPQPQPRPFRVDPPSLACDNKDTTKESMDQIFADIDRELSLSSQGRVKRFWNRVRRG